MDISSFWGICNWTRECPKMGLSKACISFQRFRQNAQFSARFLADFLDSVQSSFPQGRMGV